MRASRDPVQRGRLFWFIVSAGIDLSLVGNGAGYAFRGHHAAAYPQGFRVLLDLVPFGLYGHGWILVTLGMLNFWALGRLSLGYDRLSWQVACWTGRATLFYACVVAACLIGASWLNRQYDTGFWWYLVLAVFAGAAVALPPEFRRQGRAGRA